ncbi:MAG: cupin domain-containing protein [Chloroflexi bacterium]|nr:cupin domain-containing protein [Chloroflexota bacterium]MDA1174125.1 cupin domain-containing protein [Chloroflexota bacterium]
MATQEVKKAEATIKDVTINNVFEKAEFTRARKRILLAQEENDILIAINCYGPGSRNEMHFHVGTGQTFLVLKGTAEVTHRHKELPKDQDVVSTLKEGDSVLIPANVYYQLHNPGPDQLILYQVKQPGELVSVEGKGIMRPGDYYSKAREEKDDLSDWKEEIEPVKPGDLKKS